MIRTLKGWRAGLRASSVPELAESLGGAPYRAQLSYAGDSLAVAANASAAVTWARYYLEPIISVERQEPGPAGDSTEATGAAPEGRPGAGRPPLASAASGARFWSLMVADPARLAAAVADDHAEDVRIHLRTTARCHRLADDRLVLVDPDGPAGYVIDIAAREILHFAPGRPNDLRDLARQARELLLDARLRQGYVTVHAAAVTRDGAAVLIAGNKGSGKTTLGLQLLAEPGAGYLGNDRVLVGPGVGGTLQVLPYAMSARIGAGTLAGHPVLGRHLHAFDHFHAAVLPLNEQFAHEDKLELTPGELTELLGVPLGESAPLAGVAWPRLQPTARAWPGPPAPEVTWLGHDEAASRLDEATLLPDPDGAGWLRELLGGINARTEAMSRTLAAAAAVPALAASGGAAALAGAVAGAFWPAAPPSADPQRWARPGTRGRLVCVMHHARTDRQLRLAPWKTRAIAAGQVHELLVCRAADLGAAAVDQVAYLGFAAFDAGLVAVGDLVLAGGQVLGTVAGFDDTHLPNHMNIVCAASELRTGRDAGLSPGDGVELRPAAGVSR